DPLRLLQVRLRALTKNRVALLALRQVRGDPRSLAIAQPPVEIGGDRLEVRTPRRRLLHDLSHDLLARSAGWGAPAALARSGAPLLSLAARAPSANSARISSRSMPSASRPLRSLASSSSIVR